jgi:hypothetical protein
MECEKCGTWNPDDKVRCWRCGAELPRPPEPRKSRRISSQTWMWIMVAAFIILTTFFRCNPFGTGGGGDDTGFLSPAVPAGQPLPLHILGMVAGLANVEGAHASALPISAGYSTISDTGWVWD